MALTPKNESHMNTRPQEYYFDSEGCYITELSNTVQDPQVSIAQARVKPGITTAWHNLVDTTERYCILSGTGIVELGNAEPQKVVPGDVVIIPPTTNQRITNNGEQDLVFLAICTPRFEMENYRPV